MQSDKELNGFFKIKIPQCPYLTVQETGIKIIPKKKKCKKAKWLSEEALQDTMKRREVKGKGEKERFKFPFECRVPKNSKER